MFTLQIRTDNAAFDGGNAPSEVARILRDTATVIEGGQSIVTLRDVNGNRVGQAAMISGD